MLESGLLWRWFQLCLLLVMGIGVLCQRCRMGTVFRTFSDDQSGRL